MKITKSLSLFGMVLLGSFGSIASAQSPSSSFDVTANLLAGCSISANDINFGELSQVNINVYQREYVQIQCSKDTNLNITLGNYEYQTGSALLLKNEFADNTTLDKDRLEIYFAGAPQSIVDAEGKGDGIAPNAPNFEYQWTPTQNIALKAVTGNSFSFPYGIKVGSFKIHEKTLGNYDGSFSFIVNY